MSLICAQPNHEDFGKPLFTGDVLYTNGFLNFLKSEPLENQKEFLIISVFCVYMQSMKWGHEPKDLDIPEKYYTEYWYG